MFRAQQNAFDDAVGELNDAPGRLCLLRSLAAAQAELRLSA